MIVEGCCSSVLNVHFTSIVIAYGRPGIIVIIAGGGVSSGQGALIGDHDNATRSTITDGYLTSADRAVHDAWRCAGVEVSLIPMSGNETSAPIARNGPHVVRRLGGI